VNLDLAPRVDGPKILKFTMSFLTLCGDSCHLAFGHLFDWSSHNQSVREDANAWLAKVRSRP
jgi:hypothetical protein